MLSSRQGAVITIAHAFVDPALLRRVPHPTPLPRRPRCVVDPDHAGRVLAVATGTATSCRAGASTPPSAAIPSTPAPTPTPSAGQPASTTSTVVPAAIRQHTAVLQRLHVAPDTFLRWARAKSLYAQEPRSGRQVIVRPDTLAGLLQCSERTIQRCNAAARAIGLELVVTPGRMLSEIETYAARRRGSPQRGLSTVTAFVVPQSLRVQVLMSPLPEVGRSTPSSRNLLPSKPAPQGQ